MDTKLDLSKTSDVKIFLAKTPFAVEDTDKIVPLGGGTANWAYRVFLDKEYEGRKTVVVKHAKGWVKDIPGLEFDVDRQKYEVEALRRVGAWVGRDSKVKVGEVYLFEEEEHVIVMEDAGEKALTLKELVQRGLCSETTGAEIGGAIGRFLVRMHGWGRGNKELCEAVKGNVQAKRISAWAYYGRLEETLTGKSGLAKLSEPELEVGEEDMRVVRRIVEETSRDILAAEDAVSGSLNLTVGGLRKKGQFVMGDFWPGNIMVNVNGEGGLVDIMVLDWELVKTGLPALDVGQFCAEMDMLRRTGWEGPASAVLSQFLAEYSWSKEEERRAKIHWGTHMAVLAPRVDWGGKQKTQEIVLDGVRMLVDT